MFMLHRYTYSGGKGENYRYSWYKVTGARLEHGSNTCRERGVDSGREMGASSCWWQMTAICPPLRRVHTTLAT